MMTDYFDDAIVIVGLTAAILWLIVLPCVGLYHVVVG